MDDDDRSLGRTAAIRAPSSRSASVRSLSHDGYLTTRCEHGVSVSAQAVCLCAPPTMREHRPYEPFRFASDEFAAPSFSATSGFSPVLAGEHDDHAWKANVDLPDLGASGLTLRARCSTSAPSMSR
jgi:hypothetical protein